MTLCVCGHPSADHLQHDEGVWCAECGCQEYRKAAPEDRSLSAGVTPEGLAGETVAESVKVTPPTDEARAPEQTVEPRTEAGQILLERLRDLFASWESLAEYHNISTDELVDPLGFIAAIEREAADMTQERVVEWLDKRSAAAVAAPAWCECVMCEHHQSARRSQPSPDEPDWQEDNHG